MNIEVRHKENEIEGIELSTPDWLCDIQTTFDVKELTDYYLLYAVYSTGNSFGMGVDNAIEFIDMFQTREPAALNMEKLADHYRNYKSDQNDGSITLLTEEKKEYNFIAPWVGYFETLSYLEVKTVSLNGIDRISFN